MLSHTVPSTAFRGFGNPQQIWAIESNMDEAARQLGIDPLELRLRNLARTGDPFIPGDTPADGEWPRDAPPRGRADRLGRRRCRPAAAAGSRSGLKEGPTTGLSYSTVRLLADGSVVVYAGTSDMGQGARTIFAQIAAGELGAPIEWVTVVMGDTAVVPYDQQTSASRSSVLMGNAVLNACRDVQAKLRSMAARLEGVDEATITVDRGVVTLPDGRELPIRDVLVRGLGRLGGEVIGRRRDAQGGAARPPARRDAPAFYEFNCDRRRGRGRSRHRRRHGCPARDGVGRRARRSTRGQVRGQDEGAAIMGLGHTLMEHYIYDDRGRLRNLGAIDYRIPTSMDLPLEMTSDAIENADGPGPYGAKGMSEGALLCVAPAVAAAVRDATGVVIRDLPLTPERVWRALQEEVPA